MVSVLIRLPAYLRTEPQSDIGHNRGKKSIATLDSKNLQECSATLGMAHFLLRRIGGGPSAWSSWTRRQNIYQWQRIHVEARQDQNKWTQGQKLHVNTEGQYNPEKHTSKSSRRRPCNMHTGEDAKRYSHKDEARLTGTRNYIRYFWSCFFFDLFLPTAVSNRNWDSQSIDKSFCWGSGFKGFCHSIFGFSWKMDDVTALITWTNEHATCNIACWTTWRKLRGVGGEKNHSIFGFDCWRSWGLPCSRPLLPTQCFCVTLEQRSLAVLFWCALVFPIVTAIQGWVAGPYASTRVGSSDEHMETGSEVRRRYPTSSQSEVSGPDLWVLLNYGEDSEEKTMIEEQTSSDLSVLLWRSFSAMTASFEHVTDCNALAER